jgi:hypothetical protein
MSVPNGCGLHQDIVKKGLTAHRCRAKLRGRGAVINVNNTFIANLGVASSILVGGLFQRAALPGTENCQAHSRMRGAARTLKLFRMAFWLGVVICNLPSPASRPAVPESQLSGSRGLEAKIVHGEPSKYNFSCSTQKLCQDTLLPADRLVPWRGAGSSGSSSPRRRST